MKKLKAYFERELIYSLALRKEFAGKYTGLARRIGMPDGICEDPKAEHIVQANAMCNARTLQLIDDNDHKITEALLNVNYPDYLRPVPGCSVIQIDATASAATMTAVTVVPRGSLLTSRLPNGMPCHFSTVYAVQLAPVACNRVWFQSAIRLSPTLPRPPAVQTALSVELNCNAAAVTLPQLDLASLRIFIDAEPAMCAVTRDALFMHAATAYLELNDDAVWVALPAVPIRAVGFDQQDALIPSSPSSHPAFRLLTEYSCYPEKFNFFDIDWTALRPHLPAHCRRLTLHLGLSGVAHHSAMARSLGALTHDNFLFGCTPVVNLFKRSGRPFELTHACPDYPLLADAEPAHAYDIYSVDRVSVLNESANGDRCTEFRPYYSLRHGEGIGQRGHYYLVRRDSTLALTSPGHEMRIALVDLDLNPLTSTRATVSIDLRCTNRDLPTRLRYGTTEGELELEQIAGRYPIRMLRKPTPQYRFSADAHWRLISQFALNHTSLVRQGVPALKEMLALYDLPQSPVTQGNIAAIVDVRHRPARTWVRDRQGRSQVHGMEVLITVDEDAFAGSGLHVFAQVLSHFFGLYVHINSYAQLTILSQSTGKELLRCPPRSGAIQLV